MIFNNVVLPAPFLPMMPRPAPWETENETSRRAWIVELMAPRVALCTSSSRPRSASMDEATRSTTVLERPVRYRLETLSSWMAVAMGLAAWGLRLGLGACLDNVGEVLVGALEQEQRPDEQRADQRGRNANDTPVGSPIEDQHGAQALHDAGQ